VKNRHRISLGFPARAHGMGLSSGNEGIDDEKSGREEERGPKTTDLWIVHPVACSRSKVDPTCLAFVSKTASLAIVFLGDNIFL
jgi:hypothetical protein